VIETIVADGIAPKNIDAPAAIDALLASRGIEATHFGHWQAIDAAEVARARAGAPREKLVSIEAMFAALRG
jgi:ferredoxin--NADP+ reductase